LKDLENWLNQVNLGLYGAFLAVAGGSLQAGLLLGAESARGPAVGAPRTPGVLGPSMSVGPLYTGLWRLATALAVLGLLMLVWARREKLIYELEAARGD
jgi:hypothetical protein